MLARHRLKMRVDEAGLLQDAVAALVPPCAEVAAEGDSDPEWTVDVRAADTVAEPAEAGGPVLMWPGSGRRLTVLDTTGSRLRLAGRYNSGAAVTLMEIDRRRRCTEISVPANDRASRRWPDWVARAFFGSRLLADGWLLVHASAIGVPTTDGQRALLVLAGPRGGKSTLAYRACRELGAAMMADDLVLLRPGVGGVQVVGWPTRVSIPVELLDVPVAEQSLYRTVLDGLVRERLVVSPAEHERLLGIARAGPATLGGVLVVCPAAAAGGAPLSADRLAAALAEAAEVPAQRLMMLDLLGVAGGCCSVLSPAVGRGLVGQLAGIPAACLNVADPSGLPHLPVWQIVEPYLPMLGGRS